ncbi:hypothetical protein AB0D10_16080 [Kitasatospora sp. NPDC048545]|uniref:hypothetical protein n=1 Tax=Kitasatospora sp. NPDC048545 TaxID=3157208 RepID=UPI0033CC383C
MAGHGARGRFGLVSHRPTGRALATAAPLAAVLAGTYAAVHLWWAVTMVTDPSFQVFRAPGAQRFGPLAAAAALLAPAALMTLAVLLGRWTAARTLAVVTVVTAPLIHLLARPDLLGTVADATVFYGIGTRDSAVLVLNALVLLIAPPDRTTRPGPAVPWVLAVAITAAGVVLDLTDGFGKVVEWTTGSSHVAKKTKAWPATRPRFDIHHTPKHAGRLNQVGLFFSALTRRLRRRGRFASRDEPAAAIDTFVLACDEHDAKPYRWTFDGGPLKAA